MIEATVRLDLPLIAPGQAQKELTYNEALAALDLLVQPAVVAAGVDVPPADPAPGQCWIVGVAPTGAWSGHAHALAGWTQGGWRFVAPIEGMGAWLAGQGVPVRYVGGAWQVGAIQATTLRIGGQQVVGPRRAAIVDPLGGATVDEPARASITSILTTLRQHGLIAS